MHADLIDSIYEAAFIPDLWPSVLQQLADLSGSVGSALFLFADGQPARGRAIESQQELLAEFLANDTYRFSTGVLRMCSVRPASFLDVASFMTPEEIESDPMRMRFRAIGIGADVCTAIPMPTGELAIFILQRRLVDGGYDKEKIELLNTFRPHLARASLVAARLSLEEAHGTVGAMATMGLPSAVLSANGRVMATNILLDALSSVFVPAALSGLALGDSEADQLFQNAIKDIGNNIQLTPRSIPLAATDDRAPMIIHLVPLRRTAHDLFSGGDILVAATPVTVSSLVPEPTILTGLFDLTPAEARLATALTSGASLKEAATEQGIQFSTGRSYLERIFAKTGTHQQSQLVALLKSAQPFAK